MSEQKYELAFYGELVAGSSLDETKQLVAQLFKTNVEQIERMFTGNRVVIRNKLDQSTALKYIEALKKRGAKCQIELMGSPGEAVDLNKPEPSPAERSQQRLSQLQQQLPQNSRNISQALLSQRRQKPR